MFDCLERSINIDLGGLQIMIYNQKFTRSTNRVHKVYD